MDFFVFISEQWLLVSIGLVLVYLLAITEGNRGGRLLSTSEVVQLLNSGEAVLVDIRSKKEFDAGHITEALHIPHNNLEGGKSTLEKHKSKIIVVADKLGQHASAVGRQLHKDGYQVRRIRGGIAEWQNQNLPLVAGKASARPGKQNGGKK